MSSVLYHDGILIIFSYFFQIVFNRNHCCWNGDWIGWEWLPLTRFSLTRFFTYFFQIVFNRNHMWIRCKILISVQGECRRRGWNHCCGRGDWIGWEGRGAERGEFIWLPHPSYFLLLIHAVDIIGEISVRSRNCKK